MSANDLWNPTVRASVCSDGSILLEAVEPLDAFAQRLADPMLACARAHPDRVAFGDRKGAPGEWRRLTYGELRDQTARLGQAYLDAGLGPDRPLLLISENRIEAAIACFAAYRSGVPVASITPAYSSGRGDMDRLSAIFETLRPGMALVNDAAVHGANLSKVAPGLQIASFQSAEGAIDLTALLETVPTEAFTRAEASVGPDTVAKILFTSGSTGTPKGAINTHRMLASNVAAFLQIWPFLKEEPPVVVDWLPWNHTFGGNYVMNMMMGSGGTLYIDDGNPSPDGMARSIANAAEIKPTLHLNVPRGLDLGARLLADRPDLAAAFFERLRVVFFASAGLPERIRDDWLKLIDKHARRDVHFCSAWGTTETGPLATALNFDAPQINNIGLPIPGTQIKLAPDGGRMEIRVRGPNVTPGYLNRPDLTEKAFDDEGFWKSGDAGALADPEDPQAGLLIEGRLAEDFKLASGIWVNVGGLRAQLLESLGPTIREVVISGPQRDELGALIFLDADQCCRQFGLAADLAELAAADAVHAHIRGVLAGHNAANSGNSRRIERYRIMFRPLDPAAGELTEKGTVNQGAVLRREAALCEEMHRPPG